MAQTVQVTQATASAGSLLRRRAPECTVGELLVIRDFQVQGATSVGVVVEAKFSSSLGDTVANGSLGVSNLRASLVDLSLDTAGYPSGKYYYDVKVVTGEGGQFRTWQSEVSEFVLVGGITGFVSGAWPGPGGTPPPELSTGVQWLTNSDPVLSAQTGYGYMLNGLSLQTLTLPATASLGRQVQVRGLGTGLFRIAQLDGQQIRIGDRLTTLGLTGRVTSLEPGDAIDLVYVANGLWSATVFGNLDVA